MCSYCGCRAISVIGRFSREHDEIVDAAGELRRAALAGDLGLVRERVAALLALLHPHTGAEERGLFRELREDPEIADHVAVLCAEHDDLHARLSAVAAGNLAGVEDTVTALRRHIDREENGLFPAAAIALDGAAWERVVAATR